MNIQGAMTFDSKTKLYAVAIPLLGIWTQGKDKAEGFFMAEDGLSMLYPDLDFTLQWINKSDGVFNVNSTDKQIVPIILKEARLATGLSLMDVAKQLGYTNQNSVYAYETGAREPSVSKFQELLQVYGVSMDMHTHAPSSSHNVY